MNTNRKPMSPRIKDIITLTVCSAFALLIILILQGVPFSGTQGSANPILGLMGMSSSIPMYQSGFFWIILLFFLFCLYISFLESRDKDPFVTGKTQTMGVMNSFVGIAVIITCLSHNLISWFISAVIVCTLTFLVRELGRRRSAAKEKHYIGKTGILLTSLHNHGSAEIDGEHLKVWSKRDMNKGDVVQITEIKGIYLYVKKL